jgi:ankyrin repeat protein
VRLLLNRGADPNRRNGRGESPLHCAAMSGDNEVVELLLDHGADIKARDGEGWTPLHAATGDGNQIQQNYC